MAREWEMALDINSVLDSGVSGDEALGSLGNFKRCILRSRRHTGLMRILVDCFCATSVRGEPIVPAPLLLRRRSGAGLSPTPRVRSMLSYEFQSRVLVASLHRRSSTARHSPNCPPIGALSRRDVTAKVGRWRLRRELPGEQRPEFQ